MIKDIEHKTKGDKWTDEEIRYLIENWRVKSDLEMSMEIPHTRRAIQAKRNQLGFHRKAKSPYHTFYEVKELFKKRGYELRSTEYVNNTTPLNYICLKHMDKGVLQITLRDFLSGRGCKYCGREATTLGRRLSSEKLKSLCEEMDMIYVGCSIDNANQSSLIHYICPKHTDIGVQKKLAQNFRKKTGCPLCSVLKGEKKISNLFDSWNFSYTPQKRFEECKDKYTLPFDFYLDTFNILVEYDGEFHYKPIRKGSMSDEQAFEEFSRVRLHDSIKTKFCIEHHIPLIRIPYWEFENLELYLFNELIKLGALEEINVKHLN